MNREKQRTEDRAFTRRLKDQLIAATPEGGINKGVSADVLLLNVTLLACTEILSNRLAELDDTLGRLA